VTRSKRWLGLGMASAAGILAVAAGADSIDVGKSDYQAKCVTCHGVDGKGGGPFAELLKTPVPDLTVLSRNNGGVFPHQRVYRIIDGRETIKAHGPRDMPIWGADYLARAKESARYSETPFDAEAFVQYRVMALAEYISRLQVK